MDVAGRHFHFTSANQKCLPVAPGSCFWKKSLPGHYGDFQPCLVLSEALQPWTWNQIPELEKQVRVKEAGNQVVDIKKKKCKSTNIAAKWTFLHRLGETSKPILHCLWDGIYIKYIMLYVCNISETCWKFHFVTPSLLLLRNNLLQKFKMLVRALRAGIISKKQLWSGISWFKSCLCHYSLGYYWVVLSKQLCLICN